MQVQKSYIVKTTINLVNFEFYVRPGDLLVHDPANQNRLTVYRNGQIVKVVKQDPLGITAFLKTKWIEEISPTAVAAPVPAPVAPSKPVAESKPSKEEELALKRRKAHGVEVPADKLPQRLKDALALSNEETKPESEPVETAESTEK
jgi:hypothetical protein